MGLKEQYNHSTTSNILNFILMIIVAIPAIGITNYASNNCNNTIISTDTTTNMKLIDYINIIDNNQSFTNNLCMIYINYPLIYLNLLLFINLDLLLWIISIITNNTWLIDPYWTIIPVLIAHYYQSHPNNININNRSILSIILLYCWSIRLTHSYFRREEWNFGIREDWRFTELKSQYEPILGRFGWKLISLFIVYISQHIFLFGVTLPFYAINNSNYASELNYYDLLASIIILLGLIGAYHSDTLLREFMLTNTKLVSQGKSPVLILESGLWAYSRHPNYFSEISIWNGFSLFSIICNQYYYIWGTIVNTICLIIVSYMVENRMLAKSNRILAFKSYQQRVSMIIPWFRTETDNNNKIK